MKYHFYSRLAILVAYALPVDLFCFSTYSRGYVGKSLTLLQAGDTMPTPSEGRNSEELEDGVPANVSVIKIDDGGSDLTDRFKYKVNALMGTFDPPNSDLDDEHQNGNILNAMLFFPTQFTFNAVGKTSGNEDEVQIFVDKVKSVISSGSGDPIEEMKCETKPRGKNYTKVSVTAMVDSADVINNIFEELSSISVMRF